MTMPMDEELDYVSSSPLLSAPVVTKPQDEEDLPALKRVQQRLENDIASYSSIDRLTLREDKLTIEQQLAVNQAVQSHLLGYKTIIDTTINDIREKYSGR